MIYIGQNKIDTNIFLAPLAGCADLAFRLIAREHGAKFCFYEMTDSNSLAWGNHRKSADMLQQHPKDQPIAAQLLGTDPEIMLKAAEKLLTITNKLSFLDINAACPMRKIIKKRAGSYLLKEPKLLYKIIKKLSSALDIPITVKLRTGYNKEDKYNIATIAKNCQKAGAAALFVHGRTKTQEYSGEVDYASIKNIKANVKIPVFGSGNIFSPELAKQMIEQTGCDGVLVARGAFGNPWLLKQIEHYIKTGKPSAEISLEKKLNTLIRHIKYVDKFKQLPQKSKVGFARKVAIWYFKNFSHAAQHRNKITRFDNFKDIYKYIESLI